MTFYDCYITQMFVSMKRKLIDRLMNLEKQGPQTLKY